MFDTKSSGESRPFLLPWFNPWFAIMRNAGQSGGVAQRRSDARSDARSYANWPFDAVPPALAPAAGIEPIQPAPSRDLVAVAPPRNLWRRLMARLFESDSERYHRECEAYLADAGDRYELEARIRQFDRMAAGSYRAR